MKIGDKAPGFELKDQQNKLVSSKDLISEHVLVLFFYPKTILPVAPEKHVLSEIVTKFLGKVERRSG